MGSLWHQLALFFLAILYPVVVPVQTTPNTDLINQLKSPDREIRLAAATKLKRVPDLTVGDFQAITDFVIRDIKDALVPRRDTRAEPPTRRDLAISADDTTIPRIKADPNRHTGTFFTLVAGLRASDLYHAEAAYPRADFHLFRLDQFNEDGRHLPGGDGYAYISRLNGAVLSGLVVSAEEGGGDPAIVRLKCLIREEYRHLSRDPEDIIEIVDWQLVRPDGRGWGGWNFGGVTDGLMALSFGGEAGAGALADIATRPESYGSDYADIWLRGSALTLILEAGKGFPPQGRAAVLARLDSGLANLTRMDTPASRQVVNRFIEVAASLRGMGTEKSYADQTKSFDPSARAANLLKMGQNLEKVGNKKGALGFYKDIMAKFPDTESAKAAEKRISEIGK